MELNPAGKHKLAKQCGEYSDKCTPGTVEAKKTLILRVCAPTHSREIKRSVTGTPGKRKRMCLVPELENYDNQKTSEHPVVQYDRNIKHGWVTSCKGYKEKSRGKIPMLHWIWIPRLQKPLKDFGLKRVTVKDQGPHCWVELAIVHMCSICL